MRFAFAKWNSLQPKEKRTDFLFGFAWKSHFKSSNSECSMLIAHELQVHVYISFNGGELLQN